MDDRADRHMGARITARNELAPLTQIPRTPVDVIDDNESSSSSTSSFLLLLFFFTLFVSSSFLFPPSGEWMSEWVSERVNGRNENQPGSSWLDLSYLQTDAISTTTDSFEWSSRPAAAALEQLLPSLLLSSFLKTVLLKHKIKKERKKRQKKRQLDAPQSFCAVPAVHLH